MKPVAPAVPCSIVRITTGGMWWVRLDKRLSDESLHPFPVGDQRERDVLTCEEWCVTGRTA